MSDPPRAAAPLVVAGVVATLQAVAGALGLGLGGLETAAVGADGRSDGLSGLAAVFGVVVAVAGLVVVVVVGVPLLVLRGDTATRRVTGRGLLIGGEFLLLLPVAVAVGIRSDPLPTGTDPWSLALDLLLLVPLVVVVGLLAPSTRRWAYAPQVPDHTRVARS